MGGVDKAFLALSRHPLIDHAVCTLSSQTNTIMIARGESAERFADRAEPCLPDAIPGCAGPLAGILAGLEAAGPQHSAIVSLPVDTPFAPADFAHRLIAALQDNSADAAFAASNGRTHFAVAAWAPRLAPALRRYLETGGRAIAAFARTVKTVHVDFDQLSQNSTQIDPFFNLNTPSDLATAQRLEERISGSEINSAQIHPLVFAVSGWKSAGKTTLVERLVRAARASDLSVATIKQTHHDIAPNAVGEAHTRRRTDTDRHAAAGATATALVTPRLTILWSPFRVALTNTLEAAVSQLPATDIVIAEGFKSSSLPKIEVRGDNADPTEAPTLADRDPTVFAIALRATAGTGQSSDARPKQAKGALPAIPADDATRLLKIALDHATKWPPT